jgi:hypothetical protein
LKINLAEINAIILGYSGIVKYLVDIGLGFMVCPCKTPVISMFGFYAVNP